MLFDQADAGVADQLKRGRAEPEARLCELQQVQRMLRRSRRDEGYDAGRRLGTASVPRR
jgi:hypothetical protein